MLRLSNSFVGALGIRCVRNDLTLQNQTQDHSQVIEMALSVLSCFKEQNQTPED